MRTDESQQNMPLWPKRIAAQRKVSQISMWDRHLHVEPTSACGTDVSMWDPRQHVEPTSGCGTDFPVGLFVQGAPDRLESRSHMFCKTPRGDGDVTVAAASINIPVGSGISSDHKTAWPCKG